MHQNRSLMPAILLAIVLCLGLISGEVAQPRGAAAQGITAQAVSDTTTGILEVSVVDQATGEPIPGVCVGLIGDDGGPVGDNVCDTTGGVITVTGIPAGDYDILLTNLPEAYSGPDAGRGPSATVNAGETVSVVHRITAVPGSPQEPTNGSLVFSVLDCASITPLDCPDPAFGAEFYAAMPGTDNVAFAQTDAGGTVSFDLDQFIPDGSGTIDAGLLIGSYPAGEPSEYEVSCTVNGDALAFDYQIGEVAPGGTTYGIQFNAAEGDQVICGWWVARTAGAGNPTPSASTGTNSTAGNPTALPRTGTGTVTTNIISLRMLALVLFAGFAVTLGTTGLIRSRRGND